MRSVRKWNLKDLNRTGNKPGYTENAGLALN